MENWESEEVERNWEAEPAPSDEPEGSEDGPEEGADPAESPRPRREASDGRDMYQSIRTLVTMMAVFVLMFTFVVRVIVVSGPSMENTLRNGDLMLVWSLGYVPRQGDIVVVTQESYQEDSIVKRVIATAGQTVDIDYAAGTVYVDGQALAEKYTKEQMFVPSYGEGLNHVTVPEGCIFVMGDNRNHSADSRYPDIGVVDTRCVIGKGMVVVFPVHHWKGL